MSSSAATCPRCPRLPFLRRKDEAVPADAEARLVGWQPAPPDWSLEVDAVFTFVSRSVFSLGIESFKLGSL